MDTARPVSVAVIGAGMMGRNHLRVYDMLKNVRLGGFYDTDVAASQELATRFDCRAYASMDELIDSVDAVSICTPSITHAEIGERLLAAGRHCLIEKPLATTEDECNRLIKAADNTGVKLLVGHIERFNPAVQQVSALLDGGQTIRAIDARRLSSVNPDRITDVDVVADLMVHDLDIIVSLMQQDIVNISAEGITTPGVSSSSYVNAMLRFENDAIASLTASRITQNTVRKLTVTTDAGLIEVDYMNQSVEVYLKDSVKTTGQGTSSFGDYALDITMERVLVRRTEPLQLELSHFIDIILNEGEPLVTGDMGLSALRLVHQIQEIINRR